jgi:hypothetical protein
VTRLHRTTVVFAAGAAWPLFVAAAAPCAMAGTLKPQVPAPIAADTATAPNSAASPPAATTTLPPSNEAAPPTAARKLPPSFPKTVDEARAETEAAKKPAEKWSDSEIAKAKSRCAAILQRIHAVAIPHEPIKEGACGAPAPVELISIGQNPEVALSPPAIVRCDLAETLANWLERDLQPLARRHLRSEIIKIETMSSYSCRNAYGRKKTKLSEHGLANAVDIRGFVTASAKTAYVLEGWGTPQREIEERIAAEKAAEEKRAADAAAAEKAHASSPNLATGSGSPSPLVRSTIIEGIPGSAITVAGAPTGGLAGSIAEPDRLGGPLPRIDHARDRSGQKHFINMPKAEAWAGAGGPEPELRAFLHDAHDSACRTFGTTLGPEANAEHRNHLHVDMAPRPITKICD